MKSLIIMAIPGSGKTLFSKMHKDSVDFDGWFWENVALPNGCNGLATILFNAK